MITFFLKHLSTLVVNCTDKSDTENKDGYICVCIHINIPCIADLPQKVIEKALSFTINNKGEQLLPW